MTGAVGPRRRLALVFCILVYLSTGFGCGGGRGAPSRDASRLAPADPRAVQLFLAGAQRLKRGQIAGARSRFRRALEVDPNLWEAHFNLGVLARQRGEVRAAIGHFEAALQVWPEATVVLLALAEARYANGDRDAAADLLQGHVREHPTATDARVALATMLREANEYDDALEQAREALIRNPKNVRALLEVGRIYRAQKQYDVADLVFLKALDLVQTPKQPDPDAARMTAVIHNDLGLVALERGDTQSAFERFGQAVQVDVEFAPARLNQGAVLLNAGDYEGAAREYRAVLEVEEDNLNARVAYGIALRGAGQNAQARREYRRVLDQAPDHPAALFNLAVLRAEFLDRRSQARELFERFLEVAPPGARRRRAMAERYLSELPEAGGGDK